MMEVGPLVLITFVNISAQKRDIVEMDKLTRLVMTVVVAELQVMAS